MSGPISVVLVDDTPDIRLLLRSTFACDDRFQVVGEAEDGEEAIALVEKKRPKLVILDLAMPRMDGFETLPRLRQVAPESSVVVLSAFDQELVGEKALAAGAAAYFEKGSDLWGMVESLVELVSLRTESA